MSTFGAWQQMPVSIKSKTGVGTKGDPTYGAAREVLCYVEPNRSEVRRSDGSIIITTHYLSTHSPILADDVVYLSGDATSGRGRLIAKLETTSALSGGSTLYEVWL